MKKYELNKDSSLSACKNILVKTGKFKDNTVQVIIGCAVHVLNLISCKLFRLQTSGLTFTRSTSFFVKHAVLQIN